MHLLLAFAHVKHEDGASRIFAKKSIKSVNDVLDVKCT